jgi:hypothetical protein
VANKFTDAVFNAQLDGVSKGILYALAYRTNNDGVCWPSNKTIALDSGFGVTAVKTRLEQWRQSGLVTVIGSKPAKNGDVNIQQIDYDKLVTLGLEKTQSLEDPVATQPTTGSLEDPLLGREAATTGSRGGHRTLNRTLQLNSSLNSSAKQEDKTDKTEGSRSKAFAVEENLCDCEDGNCRECRNARNSVPLENQQSKPRTSPEPTGDVLRPGPSGRDIPAKAERIPPAPSTDWKSLPKEDHTSHDMRKTGIGATRCAVCDALKGTINARRPCGKAEGAMA